MNTRLKKRLPFVVMLALILFAMIKWSIPERIIHSQLAMNHAKNRRVSLENLIPKGTKIAVVIDKSDYQLHIYTADTLVKTYPVVFGGNPVDDKLRRGDQCTPEGTFKIVSKYPHKSWSKFIWINYPTADSWHKHKQAKAKGRIPKNANIGGEIGIHGVPKGTDYMIKTRTNWTLGCISLTNKDIDEIYPFFDKRTTITIQK